MTNKFPQRLNRREAIKVLGMSAAAATLPAAAFAQGPSFPKGAVIRAILKDYAPEELAGGATLFHEHMQLGPDFNAKFAAASAAVRAAQGLPAAAARGGGGGARAGATPPPPPDPARVLELKAADVAEAKREGIACIVDAGHPDMGRDINFLRQVSSKSGVPIVAGGGFYAQPWYTKE